MKKLFLPLFASFIALGFQSCSEDFEVAAPYKPITLVYGLLDMKDTAHYIRIQKTFLDESKNAFDMAKVSDSNFYKESDLEVVMKEYAGSILVGSPVTLKRVDMEAEGYPKNPGTFFTAPHYAYKYKATLDPTHTYRLVINNRTNNTMDSAEVRVVDATRLTLFGADTTQREVKFDLPLTNQKIGFSLAPATVGSAELIEMIMRFRWQEIEKSTGQITRDSADFPFAAISGEEIKQLKLETESAKIFNFLVSAMGPAAPGYERRIDSCHILLYGYGREYLDYVNTVQIQSSGLTADQIKPVYTNIRGKDVFGLFTSKSNRKYVRNYIDPSTMTMLMTNPQATQLRIVGLVQP